MTNVAITTEVDLRNGWRRTYASSHTDGKKQFGSLVRAGGISVHLLYAKFSISLIDMHRIDIYTVFNMKDDSMILLELLS
jgi:hypothetical protein